MNILLVTPWKLTETGGISTIVLMLSRQFRRRGHTVTVLVTDGENQLRPSDPGAGDSPAFCMYLRSASVAQTPLRGFVSFLLFLPFTLYTLYRFLIRHRIGAVVVQYPLPNAVYFSVLCRLVGAKLILVYQGNDAHDLHGYDRTERVLIQALLVSANEIVAVSKSLLRKVSLAFPTIDLGRSSIIPNGGPVDLADQVRTATNRTILPTRYVLTAGHLIPRKGMDILLRAVACVHERGRQIDLVIAGDGAARTELVRLANELGIARHVTFVGSQSQTQVLALMKACDFFVLASRAEGLPLVLAEAMACARAVVGTNVDGIPEIIQHERTGLLVDAENPPHLADAMMRLHDDPVLTERLGRCGREWALSEYDWSNIAERYLRLVS